MSIPFFNIKSCKVDDFESRIIDSYFIFYEPALNCTISVDNSINSIGIFKISDAESSIGYSVYKDNNI